MRLRVRIPVTSRTSTFVDKVLAVLSFIKMLVLRTLGGITLFAVFVLFAFLAMRVAIHGSEVTVPSLANLSDADAAATLKKLGLNLSVENRFYATTVPVNHVLSQSPVAGARVRSGWQIRVTESLGSQEVPVPDVTGQGEEAAALMLKRLQLELGSIAHLPAPAPSGVVLAQSPPPNESGVAGPSVSLLITDDEEAPASVGYVMPSIVGLSVATANERLRTAGLHISAAAQPIVVPDADLPDQASTLNNPVDHGSANAVQAPPRILGSSLITSQSPQPGHRVSRADSIHVTVSNGSE